MFFADESLHREVRCSEVFKKRICQLTVVMPTSQQNTSSRRAKVRRVRLSRALIVIGGIFLTQVILYGPSLLGYRILLPLDILMMDRMYLPQLPETRGYVPQNSIMIDEVTSIEMRRLYVVEEVREGRLPLWSPYNFCGAPFLAANNTAVFSPFRIIDYLWPSPTAIAWGQLIKSLVGGCGAFLFFRRAMRCKFWAAALGAWAFPILGFFVLWRAYPVSFTAIWLPWLLLAIDAAIRRPSGFGGPLLAVVTFLLLLSGHVATAGHVLLASGLFALFRLITVCRWPGVVTLPGLKSATAVVFGWVLGFLLSAPQSLPTVEYLQTSYRVEKRAEGHDEEPGVGFASLPQFVLPNFYGSEVRGSRYVPPGGKWDEETGIYLARGSRAEGAPQAYAGLLLTLVLAPLAWANRSRRGWVIFWGIAGFFAASHLLIVPGVEAVFDLPPFKLLKNNRFTFFTAWCVIALAVLGLDALLRYRVSRAAWFSAPMMVLMALGGWCVYRFFVPPQRVQTGLRPNPQDPVETAQAWFASMYLQAAFLCFVALVLWAVILWRPRQKWLAPAILILAVGELLWVHFGVNPQCEPELYFPKIPTLAELSELEPGRICGFYCFPACLNVTHGLRDIRGYDGVDPARLIELLRLVEEQHGQRFTRPVYAYSQLFPAVESPILDMLNLRYRIYRGVAPGTIETLLSGNDYVVTEREEALPRAYVPQVAEWSEAQEATLDKLRSTEFDPGVVAYFAPIEGKQRPELPPGPYRGTARIVEEVPSRVELDVEMETPGVVILSDLWYKGWKAALNGEPADIFQANHALRGVIVPEGNSQLVFEYDPASFRLGINVFLGSMVVLLGWGIGATFSNRSRYFASKN